MKKILISALILGSIGLWADNNEIGLKITNDTLAAYTQIKVTPNNIFVRGEYLYNDTENKNNFYLAGIKAEGNLIEDDSNLKFSVLVDFVHTKNNSALPIGIGFYKFVDTLKIPAFIQAEGEYAPKVLSFNKANRFSRIGVFVGIKPIENTKIFVGYRNISFNHNYDSSGYGGVAFSF